LSFLEQRQRSCSVEKLFNEMIEEKRQSGFGASYIRSLETAKRRFVNAFSEKLVSEISVRDIDDFLRQFNHLNAVTAELLPPAYRNRLLARREARILFGKCRKQILSHKGSSISCRDFKTRGVGAAARGLFCEDSRGCRHRRIRGPAHGRACPPRLAGNKFKGLRKFSRRLY